MINSNEDLIEDMNEAIAIFDGWQLIKGNPNHFCKSCDAGNVPSGRCTCHEKIDRFVKHDYRRYHYELKYHASWDSLMPVVEKCHKVCSEKEKEFDHNNVHDANDPTGWRAWSCRQIHLSTNIESVHREVFEFIQWYNNQTTNNE